ncbi:preprotein translocase subunit SecE [Helicobacter equorum]|uniref:preprotein translocase subunit SecE n=1 Tax=Helicobacter equorum TaxID=361872 RepID=UPI000CF055E6|nr:preprotein translocase subunit SecE [Helicobacter equorum]
MKKLVVYYRNAKEELDKVIKPTKEQVRNASISVVTVVIVITLFLALVDLISSASVSSLVS